MGRWRKTEVLWEADLATIRMVAGYINAGEIGILQTDTILGISGKVTESVKGKILNVKKYTNLKERPLIILLPNGESSKNFVSERQYGEARLLLDHKFEVPTTFLFEASGKNCWNEKDGKVGLRVPWKNEWLRRLLFETGPIFSTSANIAGKKPPGTELCSVSDEVLREVTFAVPGGRGGAASVLVDVSALSSGDGPKILRDVHGEFGERVASEIQELLYGLRSS